MIQAGLSLKNLEDFMPIDLENRTLNTLIDLYIQNDDALRDNAELHGHYNRCTAASVA